MLLKKGGLRYMEKIERSNLDENFKPKIRVFEMRI